MLRALSSAALLAAARCTAVGAVADATVSNATPPALRGAAAATAGAAAGSAAPEVVRILHLSDTHNLHHSIEDAFPMPPADILIHSGDFTDYGADAEFASANAWLGKLQGRYKHILAITGNHDWIYPVGVPAAWSDPAYWRTRLSNARVLLQENVTVMGLNIYGSSWKGGQSHNSPHGFGETPDGVDVLVTHGPPRGIFDWCGAQHWGSSDELYSQVTRHGPRAHLFGHVHEQRGLWQRDGAGAKYRGGVEYEVRPGSGHPFPSTGPPPDSYPSMLISNNAMMNHPGKEGWAPKRIAGPARLIVATRVDGVWHFSA